MNKIRPEKEKKMQSIYNFARNVKNNYNDSHYKNSSKVFNLVDTISLYFPLRYNTAVLDYIVNCSRIIDEESSTRGGNHYSIKNRPRHISPHNSRQ